ncbi:hypothetical protein ABID16_004617 [Rhizobium aquaticum]|uniref:Carboxymuconolactone decarboxylase-like domain-containing protein n=1 Tax=Rhizobium aquaticum TaxID=1549636 RepID=A0ABV2J6B0_9HYPH
MSRIPYTEISSLDAASQAILRDVPRNLFHLVAALPGALPGMVAMQHAMRISRSLDPKLREIAILRIGYLLEARYETYHHEGIGRAVGLTEAQLRAARTGDPMGMEELDATGLAMAGEMAVGPADPVTLDRVRALAGDQAALELGMTCAFYVMVCRLLTSFDIQVEDGQIDYAALMRHTTGGPV